MRPIFVIVPAVFSHQPSCVPLIQHNGAIHEFPAAALDPAHGNTILPGTSEFMFWTDVDTCASNVESRSKIRYLGPWASGKPPEAVEQSAMAIAAVLHAQCGLPPGSAAKPPVGTACRVMGMIS